MDSFFLSFCPLFHVHSLLVHGVAAGLKHRSQVRSGHRSGHRSQVRSGQVNRKNIFLPSKLTIFNSKLTRYEKESVIIRGIVYFKLGYGCTRLNPFKQNENNEFHVQIASYFVVLGFAVILHFFPF